MGAASAVNVAIGRAAVFRSVPLGGKKFCDDLALIGQRKKKNFGNNNAGDRPVNYTEKLHHGNMLHKLPLNFRPGATLQSLL